MAKERPLPNREEIQKLIEIYEKDPGAWNRKLEKDQKTGGTLIPFSSVIAKGDFIVVEEEEIV